MLRDDQIDSFVKEFYTNNPDDLLGIFAIVRAVEDSLEVKDCIMQETLRIVEQLLSKGMVAGNSPYDPGGFKPWADQDNETILNQIRSDWMRGGEPPDIPDSPWFASASDTNRQST